MAKKAAKTVPEPVQPPASNDMGDRVVTMLDPSLILGDRNVRFTLKRDRVQSMKESIIAEGGVLEPIEVEPLSDEEIQKTDKAYRAVFGHYRLAGLLEAVKEGHTFQMPAIIVEGLDPVRRFKRQMVENTERENQSPIDKAIAIQNAFRLGMSRMEIRELFPTSGGRKGLKSQPASNSFINMTLSFLELSKKIQTLIHEGDIGVADAYWLTKQPEDKRDIAVEKATVNRLKELAIAENDEERFLEEEKARIEAETKAAETVKAREEAKSAVDSAIEQAKAAAEKASELYLEKMKAEADKKKAAEDAHKLAEAEAKQATKDLETKKKELEKIESKLTKAKTDAEIRAKKLAEAKAAAASSATKAASSSKPLHVAPRSAILDEKNHPNTSGIQLTLAACRKVIKDMTLTGPYPKVAEIAKCIDACFSGLMKDGELFSRLAVITGEKAEADVDPKKRKAS